MKLTGKTLKGSYISATHESGKVYDVPTGTRVTVEVDGVEHERTVMERRVWRNAKPSKLVARFVVINNVRYEVEM